VIYVIAWLLIGFFTWLYAVFFWTKKDVSIKDCLMVFHCVLIGPLSLIALVYTELDSRGILDIKVFKKR
jgi:hypothetical protein